MREYHAANALLRECERHREAGLVSRDEYRATRRYIITALEAGNGDLADLTVAAELALPDEGSATLHAEQERHEDRQEPVVAALPAGDENDKEDPEEHNREHAQEDAETAGMPERSAPSGPMDRHTFTMVMILVGALVIAIGMLGYVLAL